MTVGELRKTFCDNTVFQVIEETRDRWVEAWDSRWDSEEEFKAYANKKIHYATASAGSFVTVII